MVIIDASPLVALFDESEPKHAACVAALKSFTARPLTTWPAITEAFYLLGDWRNGQEELWKFILAGGVHVEDIPEERRPRMHELMRKYSDNPMDLADASLVALAESRKIKRIFTLDRRDFMRYRPRHCTHFDIIP